MAEITAQAVNEFRKKTGLGLMECKSLLKEADGDLKKAETLAKERGLKQAELRAGRAAKAGRIEVYIHHDAKSGAHGRAQLRDRLRRPQRRIQAAGQGPGAAHHGRQSRLRDARGRSRGVIAEQKRIFMSPGGRQAGEHPGKDRRGQAQRLVRRDVCCSTRSSSRTTPRRSATSSWRSTRAPARISRWPGSPGSSSARSGGRTDAEGSTPASNPAV